MATQLRTLYAALKRASVADQIKQCDDLLGRFDATNPGPTIAELFDDALSQNAEFDYIQQPFLTTAERDNAQTVRTRVHDCLSLPRNNPLTVALPTELYRFTYLGREFTPLRHLKLGWVDYFAKTETRPVLGEVKCDDDKTPFYAFIQLLTYLSEMGTRNQIVRANKHLELQIAVAYPQKFDLHILLVNHQAFKPASTKHGLIASTHLLAKKFMERLKDKHPLSAAVVGQVLCLRMADAFDQNAKVLLECLWEAA